VLRARDAADGDVEPAGSTEPDGRLEHPHVEAALRELVRDGEPGDPRAEHVHARAFLRRRGRLAAALRAPLRGSHRAGRAQVEPRWTQIWTLAVAAPTRTSRHS